MQEKKQSNCLQSVLTWVSELAKAFWQDTVAYFYYFFSPTGTFYITFQHWRSGNMLSSYDCSTIMKCSILLDKNVSCDTPQNCATTGQANKTHQFLRQQQLEPCTGTWSWHTSEIWKLGKENFLFIPQLNWPRKNYCSTMWLGVLLLFLDGCISILARFIAFQQTLIVSPWHCSLGAFIIALPTEEPQGMASITSIPLILFALAGT